MVTVCDTAAETCPTWPGQGRRLHLGFPDPARVTGTDEEAREAFPVRDAIANRLETVLAQAHHLDG